MSEVEAETLYNSIKSALELVCIKVEKSNSKNEMIVNCNNLKAKITIDYNYKGT